MKHSVASILVLLPLLGGCATASTPPPREPPSSTAETAGTTTVSSAEMVVAMSVAQLRKMDLPTGAASVETSAPVENAETGVLPSRIQEHLARARALDRVPWRRVHIAESNGRVTITGQLPTVADSCEVEHAVRDVKGVQAVNNDIHLPKGWRP